LTQFFKLLIQFSKQKQI